MSPRKLTENDKQEILEQYRTSQATTSTLAKSYEVSSSTISRFLKNKLSSAEYEDLIQQKRLARTPRGEKSAKKAKDSTEKTKTNQSKSSKAKSKPEEVQIDIDVAIDETAVVPTPESIPDAIATPADPKDTPYQVASDAEPDADFSKETHASEEVAVDDTAIENEIATQSEAESKPTTIPRRRRRRPTTASESAPNITRVESPTPQDEPEKVTNKLVLDKKVIKIDESEALASDKPAPTLKEEASWSVDVEETLSPQKDAAIDNSPLSQRLILKSDRIEPEPEDDEDDDVDLITLKEMLGEDLEDFNDDEDDEDDEDWEEEDISYRTSSSLGDVQILPLSQASFPRTCYLVIDRSAELIVKPLSEFADLGMIPTEENREKTLPVFDNHRIAKRFSHRRERIIKVPDGRMLQKTSRYLQDKGITRLLIDGQIYSLIN